MASESYWKDMFTEDASFDRGASRQDKGRDEILKIINSPEQKQAIEAGMSHLAMLPHIKLNGDTAVATGYLLTVMPDTTASHVKLPGKGISSGFLFINSRLTNGNSCELKRAGKLLNAR